MNSNDDSAPVRINWVKASDYPHVTSEGPPVTPEESEENRRTAARQSDYQTAMALGQDPNRTDDLDAALAAEPRHLGLAFQVLHFPVKPGTRRLRAMLLTTALPGIALVRPETARGTQRIEPPLNLPHRILAVVSATGRDATALAARPVERPVVFRRGTVLRFLDERDLGAADVVLAIDETDPETTDPTPDDLLWLRVRHTLTHAQPSPPDADTWAYLAGSPL
jgi:hypothetical protein